MITVKLMGGMGNTMFQYACGLAQARRLNTDLRLDVSLLGGKRKYILDQWHINDPVVTGTNPTVFESGMGYNQDINKKVKDGDCLQGYWQSSKYFMNIENDLRQIFIPRQKRVFGCCDNSVALHVRRDDYLISPHKEFHGLLPMSYYRAAMSYIQERTPNPTFFIFSEDIQWAKENFTREDSIIIAPGQEAQDIYLMSFCKHAIIANSSFSWWGAWLGDGARDRIVIAPDKWFQDNRTDYSDIVPDRWLKI